MIKEQVNEADRSFEFTGDEKPQGYFVVGIGASAGGVQALKEFFEQVPAGSGMAYVVILHLSPDYDSKLAEVLQTVAAIPVLQVRQNTPIEPNHVYVVPPNQHLIIRDGAIAPSINLDVEDRRAPVDIFFRNLADTHGPRAVCVVLSGTGADGSMGLKRIKERGGVVYVQSPKEAEFNEMPRNAIATELVDEVLPVAGLPARIMAYRNSVGSVEIAIDPEQRPEPHQQALREIFTQLRTRTGNDFSNYKRPTLLRRIERRINIRSLPDLPSYAACLQENPDETHALLKDLLISVTNFFRDRKAFEALEQDVIPAIFKSKSAGDQVRIWVAGCATGEEAFSIAMLCAERAMDVPDAPKIQIFATDIDESAIAVARESLYTLNDAADVSPDRLRRFFNRDGDGYRVRREIREMVIFATHNFLKDPPFSRLDLITCRNVLIYLNSTAQERVAETFHFALQPKGFLFLGSAETVDGASDLFAAYNRENHIYQTREITTRNYPVPSSVPNFQFAKKDLVQKPEEKEVRPHRPSFGELHQRLLEQYAPPSVVVNEDYEIVHLSEKAGQFLEFTGGEPSQNLLKLIRPELRLELRSALYRAVQNKTVVEARNLKLVRNGKAQSLHIQVRPVLADDDAAKGFFLVLFKPVEEPYAEGETVVLTTSEPVAKQLEEELVLLKAQLRSSNEQHEFQAEELKASNEELQAMNEELRSSTEELETSKEELQSINEELRTVNQELKVKIEEASLTTNNLQNLINSANLGTIFLDRHFTIRLFTPAVLDVFNLKSGDYGRPVSDITHKLQYDHLLADAETVLAKLLPVEREVATTEGRHFLMRLLPYRTAEDRISGVVITFIDITKRIESEKALQQSEEYLRLIIESAKDYAIFTLDTRRRVVRWSTGAQALMGYTEAEMVGQSSDVIFTPEDRAKGKPAEEVEKAEKEGRAVNERWHLRKDGSRFWGSGSVSPLCDKNGVLMGFVNILRDLTESKEAEEGYRTRMEKEVKERTAELRKSQEQYVSLVENTPDIITRWNKDLTLLFANSAFESMTGTPLEGSIGKTSTEMGHAQETAVLYMNSLQTVFETGKPVEHYHSFPAPEGARQFFSRMVPEKNAAGQVETVLAIARDITDLKEAEQEIIAVKEELTKKATDKYLLLFNAIDEGFYLAEVIFDEANRPVDIYYHEENPAAVRILGTSVKGKKLTDVSPDYERHWYDIFGSVALTGETKRMEQYSEHDQKWFNFYVTKIGGEASRQIAIVFHDVTDLKTARQQLEESRDLLQSVFDVSYNGLSVLKSIRNEKGELVDMEYLLANEATKRVNNRQDLEGKRYSALHAGFRGTDYHEVVKRVVETGEPHQYQLRYNFEHLDNWFNITTVKLNDGVVVSFEDITEVKKAEITLRESEERKAFLLKLTDRLRTLSDSLAIQGQAAWLLQEHFNAGWAYYCHFNESNNHIRVLQDAAREGLPSLAGEHPFSDMPEFLALWQKGELLQVEDFHSSPLVSQRAKDLYRPVGIQSFLGAPVVKDGQLIAVLVLADTKPQRWTNMAIELTIEAAERTWAAVERANAEEALRQSKERLQLIIESAKGFAIHTTTADGVINSWNTGAAEIFGWPEEEIIGQRFEVLFTPEDRAANQPQIEMEIAAAEGVAPDVRWHLHRNGSLVFIDGVSHPVYEAGRLNGFVKIGRDMTAQHNAEMALRKAEEAYRLTLEKEVEQRTAELKEINTNLRYANENLEQFASIASHDLQEPLRKIRLYSSVLHKKWSNIVPDEGKEIIQKITRATDRMGQLIREVLEYSRIAYSIREFEPTDLHGTLQNVFGDLNLLMEETGASISYPVPLPTVDAIPLQMHQLFYNLTTNALKFRREGIEPEIRITAGTLAASEAKKYDGLVKDTGYLEIVVSDNGIGFDPQFAEQIFQIFERLHTADEFAGTGVGLALCKKIVENHRGHIFATSKEGEGASFHVILPLKQ